jgi:hypothetical protein
VQMYHDFPDRYDEASFRQVKSGRTCAIVGLSLSGFALIIVLIIVGANS